MTFIFIAKIDGEIFLKVYSIFERHTVSSLAAYSYSLSLVSMVTVVFGKTIAFAPSYNTTS